MPTQLPELRRTRALHTVYIADNQLSDPLNFGLDEFYASALSAIFIALAMLLLADIIYRLVVRARDGQVSSFAVQRSYLLARVTNPIALFSWFVRRARRARPQKADKSTAPLPPGVVYENRQKPDHSAFPNGTRAFVFALGSILVLSDLVFIFLSTSASEHVFIDSSNLTSITLRTYDSNVVYDLDFLHDRNCLAKSMTAKPYFISSAQSVHCITFDLTAPKPEAESPPGIAYLVVGVQHSRFLIQVTTASFRHSMEFGLYIIMSNHSNYNVVPDVTHDNVTATVPDTLRRFGLPFAENGDVSVEEEFEELAPGFAVQYAVNMSGLALPASFRAYTQTRLSKFKDRSGQDVQAETLAWNLYIGNVAAGLISQTGTSEALDWYVADTVRLSGYENSFIEKKAPRLSLGGCVLLCGALIGMWLFVALWLRWRSSVEHRFAWVHMFEAMMVPDDLERSHDQFVNVQTTRTSMDFVVRTANASDNKI